MTGRLRCPDCDGPVQACARLGRIPVWAICTVCRREWLAQVLDDGAIELERHETRRSLMRHGGTGYDGGSEIRPRDAVNVRGRGHPDDQDRSDMTSLPDPPAVGVDQ